MRAKKSQGIAVIYAHPYTKGRIPLASLAKSDGLVFLLTHHHQARQRKRGLIRKAILANVD
ncbi:MAG: hypothetical protein ACR2RF_05780 [Geminicoccaceae bacterium]